MRRYVMYNGSMPLVPRWPSGAGSHNTSFLTRFRDQEHIERADRELTGPAETACAMKTSSSITETDGRKKMSRVKDVCDRARSLWLRVLRSTHPVDDVENDGLYRLIDG